MLEGILVHGHFVPSESKRQIHFSNLASKTIIRMWQGYHVQQEKQHRTNFIPVIRHDVQLGW